MERRASSPRICRVSTRWLSLSAKHVVLSSAYLASVQVLDRVSGEILRTIPNPNGVQGALELPDGTLLVAEATTGRLVRVDAAEPAKTTALTEGLQGPVGLVADTEADEPGVYVTEVRSGRVTRVRLSGTIYVSSDVESTIYRFIPAP